MWIISAAPYKIKAIALFTEKSSLGFTAAMMADIIWFHSLLKTNLMRKLAEHLKRIAPGMPVSIISVVSQVQAYEITKNYRPACIHRE